MQRSFRKKCPCCGRGALFSGFSDLNRSCPRCQLKYEANPGDTWAFMYISTAAVTGVFLVVLLWVWPPQTWLGRSLLALAAVLTFFLTWPTRKAIAVGLNYWLATRLEPPESLPPCPPDS